MIHLQPTIHRLALRPIAAACGLLALQLSTPLWAHEGHVHPDVPASPHAQATPASAGAEPQASAPAPASHGAHAQHGSHAPSAGSLPAVLVTGDAPKAPLHFSTDPKLPRQPLPASDAADYLKTIPGFSAVRNGGSNSDPVLRGMFGSRLALLTDGDTLLGACPWRMDAPSAYISPESFDQLTVIKGPQTVIWGPGASAGTVRFDRSPPQFEEGRPVKLDASLTAGSAVRRDAAVDFAAGTEQLYVRVAANHGQAKDYEDGSGHTVPSLWKKWGTDVALGLRPDADTLLELRAGAGDGEARYAGRGMDGSRFRRDSWGLKAERSNIGQHLKKLELNVYGNETDHVMDNFSLRQPSAASGMAMPMASNVGRKTSGLRLASTWQLAPTVGLVAGLDALGSKHRARSGHLHMAHSLVYSDWARDANMGHVGAFGELSWQASEAGTLIAGLRLDRARAKDERSSIASMGASMPNPTAGQQRRDTLRSGFVRYEQQAKDSPIKWYAGLGHAQRFPDYWELFSPNQGPAGAMGANAFSGLRPEKTTQLDVGAVYTHEGTQAWVSAYAGSVRDFVLFRYKTGGMMGSVTQASNVNARTRGGELGISQRLGQHWKAGATVAYAWAENHTDGGAMPQIPPAEARLSLAYDTPQWSAGALWRVVAAQKRVAKDQGNVTSRDFGPSSGFGVLSINGSYRLSANARLAAGIDNLLDKTYAEHLNLAGNAGFGYAANTRINEPGRQVWLKLNLVY